MHDKHTPEASRFSLNLPLEKFCQHTASDVYSQDILHAESLRAATSNGVHPAHTS